MCVILLVKGRGKLHVQLAKHQRVLYVKPFNKVYAFHQMRELLI